MTRKFVLPSLSLGRAAGIIIAAILLSFTVEPALAIILPVAPAIPLVVVFIIAAHNGPLSGVVSGVIAGFIIDLCGSGALGVNSGAYALVGYLAGRVIRVIPPWRRLFRLSVAAPVLLAQVPAAWILAWLSGDPFRVGPRSLLVFLVVNIVAVQVIAPAVSAVEPEPQRA